MADLGTRLQEALTALRLDKEDLDHDQLSGLRDAIDGAYEDGYAESQEENVISERYSRLGIMP